MDLQEIEVIIGKDGQVQLLVRGVKGLTCLELTKELEAVLGGQIEAREMTPEAQETTQEQVKQRQWQKSG
ncbi:MAG: hypothetical protein Fur0044_37760 [Anaerolineae bacterium]|nr:DUF2997 domain-containing protein [Anaerolineales bacterium]MCQ3978747.1 hypothetical protein [Anaerolineae bacterium]